MQRDSKENGLEEFEKLLPGSIDFFRLSEYKNELPPNICKAIKEFKTHEDQKIIGEWIRTTQNKNALNEDGNSSVHLAIDHLHPSLALWLFGKGVDINVLNKRTHDNALSQAIIVATKLKPGSKMRQDYINLIDFLIANKAVMAINSGFGIFKYALCIATLACDLEIIKLLVEKGHADVNYSKDLLTPIGYASSGDHSVGKKENVISYLQSKGATLSNSPQFNC